MIGLLLKDYYVMKKQLKIVLIALVFYAVLSYADNNVGMFIYMAVMFGFFMPITTMAYDDRCEWNKYAKTMPINMGSLVTSKYVFGILGITLGTISFLLLTFLLQKTIDADSIEQAIVAISIGSVALSIFLPLCFKFGVEKSRFIIIAIIMIPSLLLSLLAKGHYIKQPTEMQINSLIHLAPLIAICFILVSIYLSIAIMKRKEF